MVRKFRIIQKLSYSYDELNEEITICVQERKRGFFGKWKWCYWKKLNYDMMEKRTFQTVHHAKEMIKKLVSQKPYEKVVEEITF